MKKSLFVLALLLSYTAFGLLPGFSFMVQSEPDPTFSSSMIVLVDNSVPKQTHYNYYADGVGKWLEWWKIDYEEVDVSTTTISRSLLSQYSVILIAQFQLVDAGSVDSSELQAIYQAVTEDGVGLIQVDSYLSSYQSIWPDYLSLFNVTVNNWVTSSSKLGLTIPSADHFITEIYRQGTTMNALFPDGDGFSESSLVFQNVTSGSGATTLATLLHQSKSYPAVIANTEGFGNIVLSTFSTGRVSLGMTGYDGYGERMNSKTTSGMNGLLWRSIVWASKKPFAFMGMPPFLNHRTDDVAAEIQNPIYLDKILEYGFWGDFNLFQTDVENRGESYQDMLKNMYLNGSAHFSPHAWTDTQSIYWNHGSDTEYPPSTLSVYFDDIDEQYESWGITPSAMFVAHYYQIGANALPFLRERGWLYTNTFYRIPYSDGIVEGNWIWESDWKRPGVIDYIDADRTVFDISIDMPVGDPDLAYQDYLEGAGGDVDVVTSHLLCALEHGLSDLFWGQVFTHEQRCWEYSADDWDNIFSSVFGNLTAQYPFTIKASGEFIERYVQNRANVSIVGHSFSGNTLTIDLSGNSTLPIALYVFSDSKIASYTGMLDYFRDYGDDGYMIWIPPYEDGHQTTITFGDVETNSPRVQFTTANITSTSSSPDQMTISAKPVWIHDEPLYLFEVNCSTSGRPVSIFTAQGNRIKFSYDEATKIATFNRTLPIAGSDTILTWARAKLDFGTVDSPVESGYTQVTNVTLYSPSVGYGWSTSDNLWTRDRGAPDSLRRDFVCGNLTEGSTFNVDLANDDYWVTVVLGDQGYMHDQVDVYAEGVLVVNDLTVLAGSFQEVTFEIAVADGQLNLRIVDDGGVDPNWVLNALTIVVVPPPATEGAFDFGTDSSPVEAGCTQVSPLTAYSLSWGYGWSSVAGLDSRDRGSPDDLREDFVFGSSEHTFSVDLADDEYLVTVVLGDENFMHDQIDVYAEDVLVLDDLTAAAGSFQERSFRVAVADEQLNLRIADDGGVDPYWVLAALSVEVASPLPTGGSFDFGSSGSPVEVGYVQVSTSTVYSALYGYGWSSVAGLDCRDRGSPDALREDFVFSAVGHTFSVDLADGEYLVTVTLGDESFMHDGVSVYAEGVLVIDGVTVLAGEFQEVSFRVAVADEQLNIGIVDEGGFDPYWVLTALTVEVASPLPTDAAFDFGTSGSPVASGYVQVSTSTVYSASVGYGWSSVAGLDCRDRGSPDALRSDFVFGSSEHTFNVDLANGDYAVTVTIGDLNYMHDNIDVYAEDTLKIDDLGAAMGSFQEVMFTVSVADGQLSLRILDDGGADPNWVLNALTISAI